MRCTFLDSDGVYTFGTSPSADDGDTRLAPNEAKRALAVVRGDPARMQWFRKLLAESWPGGAVSQLSEGDVIARLAAQVDARRLYAYHQPTRHLTYELPEAEEVDEALGPASVAEVAEEAAPLDGSAQAAVLLAAARDGVPFCEECERARQAANASPAAAP